MLERMQKLLLPLLVALLALGAAAGPAQALTLPPLPLVAPADEEESADETGAEDEAEEGEDSGECTIEDEEDVQICAEIAAEEAEEVAIRLRCGAGVSPTVRAGKTPAPK